MSATSASIVNCTVHNNYYCFAHCIQIGAKGFLDTKESSRTTKERGTCTVKS